MAASACWPQWGHATPEFTDKLPPFLSTGLKFEDISSGLATAFNVSGSGTFQVIVCCLSGEATGSFGYSYDLVTIAQMGACGWKPPLSAMHDRAFKRRRLNIDVDNGRWGESSSRTGESELGVLAPVGYWDPLSLAQAGDAATIECRRVTKIKHGRISSLATMGYVAPELTEKLYVCFPLSEDLSAHDRISILAAMDYAAPELTEKFNGCLPLSPDLSVDDVPSSLAVISKASGAGWREIIAYRLYRVSAGGFGSDVDASKAEQGDWTQPRARRAQGSRALHGCSGAQ